MIYSLRHPKRNPVKRPYDCWEELLNEIRTHKGTMPKSITVRKPIGPTAEVLRNCTNGINPFVVKNFETDECGYLKYPLKYSEET